MKKQSILAIILCVIIVLCTSCSSKEVKNKENKGSVDVTTSTDEAASDNASTKKDEENESESAVPKTTTYKINLKDRKKMNVKGVSFYIPNYEKSQNLKYEDAKIKAKYQGKLYEFKGKNMIGGYAIYSGKNQYPSGLIHTQYIFEDSVQSMDEWMIPHILYQYLSWDKNCGVSESDSKEEVFKNFKSEYSGIAYRYTGFIYASNYMNKVDNYDEYVYYYSEIFPINKNETLVLWVADLTKDNSLTAECKKVLIDYYLKDYLKHKS